MKRKLRLTIMLTMCGMLLMLPLTRARGELKIQPGILFHAQQALERYDALGEAALQYLELWMDASGMLQREVGEDGRPISFTFSRDGLHYAWDQGLGQAVRTEQNRAFFLDYTSLIDRFTKETRQGGQSYAGRSCTVILLEDSKNEDDWLKIYLDDETGFVLFCQAPLFRLRTSLLEILPFDDRLLTPPEGLDF